MRGQGFEPHTKQMLNAGHRLQFLNMERQEPIFLHQTDAQQPNYSSCVTMNFTFHSTRMRGNIAGDCYCLVYRIHPLLPGGTGQTINY